eukprot:602896-Prymnesium_polylepis.1
MRCRLLLSCGFKATLEVLEGAPHAFLTLPPAYNPTLSETHSKPATRRIIDFCAAADRSAAEQSVLSAECTAGR